MNWTHKPQLLVIFVAIFAPPTEKVLKPIGHQVQGIDLLNNFFGDSMLKYLVILKIFTTINGTLGRYWLRAIVRWNNNCWLLHHVPGRWTPIVSIIVFVNLQVGFQMPICKKRKLWHAGYQKRLFSLTVLIQIIIFRLFMES